MERKYTPAQAASSARYDKKHGHIRVRTKTLEDKERYEKYAQEHGMSLNTLFLTAVEKEIQRNNSPARQH